MEALTQWLQQPFNQDQTAWRWFLFVGLIVIALILWGMIVREVRGAI